MMTLPRRALALSALACVATLSLPVFAVDADPVVLTFSSVGDSRQDPNTFDKASVGSTLSGQDAIWLQNTKAYARILRTIQAQKSSMLFFNGDMIHGYGWASFGNTTNKAQTSIVQASPTTTADVVGSDLLTTYQQYGFWRGMVAPVLETGTYVFPVPGNHEVQCKACPKNSDGQRASKVENEKAWADNMGDLILDSARFSQILGSAPVSPAFGPAAGLGPDGLTTDQSKLGYSFDHRGQHFVVINTDPVGAETHAPTQWLAADLAAAKSRGVKKIFVFGHKPAFTYNYVAAPGAAVTGAGLDATATTKAARDAFWNVIEANGATYFAGHEHVYNISRPKGGAYQVIIGAGGSPFEASSSTVLRNPATDRSYSWATVKVRQSGAAELIGYGFDEHFGPTTVIEQINLP